MTSSRSPLFDLAYNVNDYIKKSDLYEIIWVQNTNIKKKVSRFNLIFDLEDKALFEQRLNEAHKMRE